MKEVLGQCRTCGEKYNGVFCTEHDLNDRAMYWGWYCICNVCNGTRVVSTSKSCKHGQYEQHQYCTHDYTYQHD